MISYITFKCSTHFKLCRSKIEGGGFFLFKISSSWYLGASSSLLMTVKYYKVCRKYFSFDGWLKNISLCVDNILIARKYFTICRKYFSVTVSCVWLTDVTGEYLMMTAAPLQTTTALIKQQQQLVDILTTVKIFKWKWNNTIRQ